VILVGDLMSIVWQAAAMRGFEWSCFKWTPVWCYSCAHSLGLFLCHNLGGYAPNVAFRTFGDS